MFGLHCVAHSGFEVLVVGRAGYINNASHTTVPCLSVSQAVSKHTEGVPFRSVDIGGTGSPGYDDESARTVTGQTTRYAQRGRRSDLGED